MSTLTYIAMDLVAILVLVFGLYLPRHNRRDLVVAFLGVNVGVMAVSAALLDSAVTAGLGLGLFGVLSHTTAQRTREIGLRTALGAQRADVLALVGRQAMAVTVSGLAAGLAVAFILSQSVSVLLYGVTARDAISFLVVPLVVMLVSIAACALPAWRATRINPIDALRAA